MKMTSGILFGQLKVMRDYFVCYIHGWYFYDTGPFLPRL